MENEREQFNGDGKECIHHWLIDARNFGVCKKCGTSKQFCSSWGDHPKILVRQTQQGAAWCPRQQELTDHVASLGNGTFYFPTVWLEGGENGTSKTW